MAGDEFTDCADGVPAMALVDVLSAASREGEDVLEAARGLTAADTVEDDGAEYIWGEEAGKALT